IRVRFDKLKLRNTPMSGHRLSGPNGTNLFCRVVAHGEHKVHFGSTGFGELAPILGSPRARWPRGGTDRTPFASAQPNPLIPSECPCRGRARPTAQERALYPLLSQPGFCESSY